MADMFKKKSMAGQLLLKFTDYKKYKQYRYDYANHKVRAKTAITNAKFELYTLPKLHKFAKTCNTINVAHGGNAGDIVYAMATIKRIHELTGLQINFYLQLGQELNMPLYREHPSGNVGLNQQMAELLLPLINDQHYIAYCATYLNEKIDIDLSVFRELAIPSDKGNLAHWYNYITGVMPRLHLPWLTITTDENYCDKIVISRSSRYRSSFINYSFLNQYDNLCFLGIQSEFDEMKALLPKLQWIKVTNFKQMAEVIAGCKFFIGNQSMPFSLAEALKVPRILETYFHAPNVITTGNNGYDFYFQEHFEALVEQLNGFNK